ncbi:glycosyltransferase family 2 protein [Dyadobacter sp. 3J3]|uniref:glycosyltransferase family 2 protein n=1 Tax=Dyadobacter sp. 3J3 TaxID=2606600 RepID=UPI001357E4EE|nr:glycosyltransferase family 2 protein [Dyadobacter sp. 3J3]
MDVSVIIVNYNTSALLNDCLTSVYTKTLGIKFEVIVVDNNSVDESVRSVRENFSDVKLIESKKNLGFGKGNNLGNSIASGKYLFYLNSDTILINNAIKILFEFMEKEDSNNVACCGGNLYHEDGKPNFSYSIRFPSLFGIILYRAHLSSFFGHSSFNDTSVTKKVAIVIGADMMISKEKFDLIGGFDPQYFMYVEEGDLQYRFHKKGWSSMSVPDAKIIHKQGASSGNLFKLKSEIKSYLIFYHKFFNKPTSSAYKLIELFFAALKYIAFTIIGKRSKRKDYWNIIKFLMGSDAI